MSLSTNLALNAHAAALQTLEKMEDGYKQCLNDLRALKEGTKLLSDLTITDDGYDFVPAEPPDEEERSGFFKVEGTILQPEEVANANGATDTSADVPAGIP